MKTLFKYFLIFICSTLIIIFSSIFLRRICIENLLNNSLYKQAHAKSLTKNNKNHLLLLEDKPLYKTSSLENEIITLPKTYYIEALSNTTNNVVKVSYNGITGFISNTDIVEISPIGNLYQTSEASTSPDAGTYLREAPTTTSKKLTLIPASSKIVYIGYTISETPSDGTSNLWYLIDYEVGPTTTHRGYIYAERVILSSPLISQPMPNLEKLQTSTLNESPENKTSENLTGTINLSNGVKWFLIILFGGLAIVVFALLMFAPKREPKTNIKKKPSNEAQSPTKISGRPPLNNSSPQNFKRSKTKRAKNQYKITSYQARTHSEYATELGEFKNKPLSNTGANNPPKHSSENNILPAFISKYFKINPTQDDDEPL